MAIKTRGLWQLTFKLKLLMTVKISHLKVKSNIQLPSKALMSQGYSTRSTKKML